MKEMLALTGTGYPPKGEGNPPTMKGNPPKSGTNPPMGRSWFSVEWDIRQKGRNIRQPWKKIRQSREQIRQGGEVGPLWNRISAKSGRESANHGRKSAKVLNKSARGEKLVLCGTGYPPTMKNIHQSHEQIRQGVIENRSEIASRSMNLWVLFPIFPAFSASNLIC